MTTTSATYQYHPLQYPGQIRLLRLQPGDELASIQITIFPVLLGEKPIYEALSYTWGDPNPRALISCNEDGDTIEITLNCEAALRRLRAKDKERILWIDAVCIDQSNIGERSRQVRLMSMIYQQAQRVLAYLGEASDDSDLGIDFILEDAASTFGSSGRPSVGLGPNNFSSPQQKAVDRILERPYFERIWILQEILLAREVQVILGNKTVDWRAFSRTVYHVDKNKKLFLGPKYHGKPPKVVFYRDQSTKRPTLITDKPDSLLAFLKDTRHCKSSDPRDMVYALLGMSLEKDDFLPNYDLSTRDVFISLTKFFIKRDKKLDVLCHVQGARSPYNLPSWVPDWSYPRLSDVLGHEKTLSIRPYKAALDTNANVNDRQDTEFLSQNPEILFQRPEILFQNPEIFFQNPERMMRCTVNSSQSQDILVAEGIPVDTVSRIGPMYTIDDEMNTSSLQQWEDIAKTLPRDPTETDVSSAFIDTLIAYPAYRDPNPFARFYPAWCTSIFSGQPPDASAAIFQEQLNKVCHGRCFFVTGKGYMGLGPPEMQKEDLVAVLLGGSVPFVLHAEEQEQFSLVGESYVHGLMNGEALEELETKRRMFHIK